MYPSAGTHKCRYVALLLYLWVVWGGLTRVAPCLLLGFWAVERLQTTGARKGRRTAEYGSVGTELTGTVAEIVHIDDKASRTIDANLDHDLFQGLIESTNT